MPAETASSNHLTRALQSSSQTQAILIVRTGISAITFAFLFRKEWPLGFLYSFFNSFHRMGIFLCGGIPHTDLSPVAVFILLPLHLQISLSVTAVAISTNFSPHFSWVLHDNSSQEAVSDFRLTKHCSVFFLLPHNLKIRKRMQHLEPRCVQDNSFVLASFFSIHQARMHRYPTKSIFYSLWPFKLWAETC